MQTDKLLKTYEQLMLAAAGETSFANAIASITVAFNAVDGVVFELNRKTGAISNWVSPGLVAGADAYSQHINSINPRMRYSLRHAAGHVAYEHKFIDTQMITRHEFYDWLNRSYGLGYFLGSRLYDDGDISVFHSIEFDKKQGHPEKEKIEAFQNTSHALANAWRLASRAPKPDSANDVSTWTPNHLPWAIFAISSRGQVLEMNNGAHALIEEGKELKVVEGFLGASDQNSTAKFEQAIKSALAGISSDILLQGAEGKKQLVVQMIPIATRTLSSLASIAALIYVWSPMDDRRNIDEKLRHLWLLTSAEATLAIRLMRGENLTIAAEKLSISRNTARNQLQQVFAKTKTSSQVELASMIFGVIGLE